MLGLSQTHPHGTQSVAIPAAPNGAQPGLAANVAIQAMARISSCHDPTKVLRGSISHSNPQWLL